MGDFRPNRSDAEIPERVYFHDEGRQPFFISKIVKVSSEAQANGSKGAMTSHVSIQQLVQANND